MCVSSAKGGVGKSTVAVNIAAALYKQGLRVGLLDMDIFGPSVPRLLGVSGEPKLASDGSGKLVPKSNYGIQAMSMGLLVDPNKAIAWRGLLVQKALEQLLFDVEWDVDVLVLDMPPGTGDVQLTLLQQVKLDGAVIVSTPQDIALIDAVRGIDLFRKLHVPILGLVQNMSMHICPNCGHESHIFGHDGALREAAKQNIHVLGSVPLDADICQSADDGKPMVVLSPDSTQAKSYIDIAHDISQQLWDKK